MSTKLWSLLKVAYCVNTYNTLARNSRVVCGPHGPTLALPLSVTLLWKSWSVDDPLCSLAEASSQHDTMLSWRGIIDAMHIPRKKQGIPVRASFWKFITKWEYEFSRGILFLSHLFSVGCFVDCAGNSSLFVLDSELGKRKIISWENKTTHPITRI